MEETREERAEVFSRIVYQWPLDVKGKSVRQHAKDMGVTPKTYTGWMDASDNTSYIWDANRSFEILGINPLYYYGAFLHPEMRNVNRKPSIDHQRLALEMYVRDTTEEEIQVLHWLRFGDHGAVWKHMLQIFVADAHLPMEYRVLSTNYIAAMYDHAKAAGILVGNPLIEANEKIVVNAMNSGKTAVIGGSGGYVAIPSQKEYYEGRIGSLLEYCRIKGGVTKEKMAGDNNCRVETITNYERSISYPNFFVLTELIRSTGLPVFPILYGEMYQHPINREYMNRMSKEREELIRAAQTEPEQIITWVIFMILGQHGGSWHCMLHKMAMFARLPSPARIKIAEFISTQYDMAYNTDRIVCQNQANPKLDELRKEFRSN